MSEFDNIKTYILLCPRCRKSDLRSFSGTNVYPRSTRAGEKIFCASCEYEFLATHGTKGNEVKDTSDE